jgi:hypothetical protein
MRKLKLLAVRLIVMPAAFALEARSSTSWVIGEAAL